MADLDKLKKNASTTTERVKIEPTTRAGVDAKPKQVILRLHPDAHTAFRRKALDEGTTMQQVLTDLVDRYLADQQEHN